MYIQFCIHLIEGILIAYSRVTHYMKSVSSRWRCLKYLMMKQMVNVQYDNRYDGVCSLLHPLGDLDDDNLLAEALKDDESESGSVTAI